MFVVLHGPEGVDDSFVASMKLGIVVQGFANGVALCDGGVHALEGSRVAGFELGLSTGRFGDQGSELLVTARLRVERGPDRVPTKTGFC